MFGCVKMTDKRNLGRNAKKNSQLGWNCFKKILIMFFITICLLKVKKMTRLSHIPFTKSFLAISLSAVFSGAVYAGVEQIPTNEDFIVTVNGIEQEENYSIDTNPSGSSAHWWGPLESTQSNSVQITVKPSEDSGIPKVAQDTYGGWSSTGVVENNKVTIEGPESKKLLLMGSTYGGYSNQVEEAKVNNNQVSINSVTLDEEMFLFGGTSSYLLDYDKPAFEQYGLSSSVTNNSIVISDSSFGSGSRIAGGSIINYGGDIAYADGNSVVMTNVQGSNKVFSSISIYGGNVARALKAYASNNRVELTNVFNESSIRRMDSVIGGRASGWETHVNNNVLNLTNSSFASVCAANANSNTSAVDLISGAAEAYGNKLFWKNTQDTILVPLVSLTVAEAKSDTKATVSSNYAELSGIKTVDIMAEMDISERSSLDMSEEPQVMGFFANTGETGEAIVNGNVLKINQSHLDIVYGTLVSGKKTETKNNSIVVSGAGDRNLMSMEQFVGFQSVGYELSNLNGNTLFIEDTTSNAILSMNVAGNADIRENTIMVKNAALNAFRGIIAQSTENLINRFDIENNHITLDNISWFDIDHGDGGFKWKASANMVESYLEGNITIKNNTFEVVNSKDANLIDLVGISLLRAGSDGQTVIENNTLFVKDSKFDNIIGIELAGRNLDYTQLFLSNNTIILDSVEVAGGVYSIASQSGIRSTLPQSGKLILRGHNSAESVSGFDTFQFDLDTAENNLPMLTYSGTDNVVLKNQTFVLNNAEQANIDQISLIGMSTPDASLIIDNVTLRTEGTFAFKSMVLNGDLNNGALELSQYYDTLKSQQTQADVSTRTLSDSQLATIALTRQSSEEALNLLQSTENLSVDAPMKGFASLSGSSNFYELGTGFDLNGTSLTVGGALRINDKWSGVGFANFSDANADSTVEGFRGDSDIKTYSAGVALRYQTEMPFYTEGALVVGQADTDFVGYYTNDTARYDTKRLYTTAQLGVGSDFALSDNVNLNLYGRYSFTYLDGDKVSLNNTYNDTFDVDDTMVHAMRVGARVKGSVAPNVQWFAGAAFERVLDGDVEAMVKDAKLKTETLKGNVGIFEVGATLAPNDLGPWTMDVKAGAYAGDRRGISGSVNFNYVF